MAASNLNVLGGPAFEIAAARPAGDFGAWLGARFLHFFEQTARLVGPLAGRRPLP